MSRLLCFCLTFMKLKISMVWSLRTCSHKLVVGLGCVDTERVIEVLLLGNFVSRQSDEFTPIRPKICYWLDLDYFKIRRSHCHFQHQILILTMADIWSMKAWSLTLRLFTRIAHAGVGAIGVMLPTFLWLRITGLFSDEISQSQRPRVLDFPDSLCYVNLTNLFLLYLPSLIDAFAYLCKALKKT